MSKQNCSALFSLGQILMTPGVQCLIEAEKVHPFELLARHQCGDFGDVGTDDANSNTLAIGNGERILSSYTVTDNIRVWIITEANRASTTLLLPEEY